MNNCMPILVLLLVAGMLAGCQQPAPTDMTFSRGAQLLAAGSPKSAIPLLAQTVASTPDGPEPVALLALAYALDGQADRAILQVQHVHRPKDAAPGWEGVALAVAQMTRHRPDAAAAHLNALTTNPKVSPGIAAAAMQWLAMAYALQNDSTRAAATLEALARNPQMRTSALLWSVLVHSKDGQRDRAAAALQQCAKSVAAPHSAAPAAAKLDDQAMYDAGIAALAAGEFDSARRQLTALAERSASPGDARVWQALLAAATTDWSAARALLKDACGAAPIQSRGLANQLFAIVCAMEDRPDAMLEHLLAGQRMLARNASPTYTVRQPSPEPVWGSDQIK